MKVSDVTKLIKKVDISKIIPDDSNPNVMTDEEMVRLENSLNTYGFIYPLLINQDFKIIDGHHRFYIYKKQNMKEVPVIQLNVESEAQHRLLRQTLSKLHGTPDLELDLKELEYIINEDEEGLKNLLAIDNEYIEDLKKSLKLSEPHFRQPKEDVEDVMKDLDIKKVLQIPVSDEVLKNIKDYMKRNEIGNYEELLENIDWESL